MTKIKWMFTLLLSMSMTAAMTQNLVVSSYNLRYDSKTDSGNMWMQRKIPLIALIRFHDFDIIGTQEALENQLNDITTALPVYTRYGVGRDDGKTGGEHSAILYKKDRFDLLNKGDFWLSQTPDQPTLGWDATCCKRLCSWVYLLDKKTKKKFYVFNAHYDHQGKIARVESSKLIIEKIKSIAGKSPVIFTGDLNGGHETECYQIVANSGIVKDTYTQVEYPYANGGSFNDWGRSLNRTDIIDHIFVTPPFTATKWGILTDSYKGKYPSDHFAVMAVLRIN